MARRKKDQTPAKVGTGWPKCPKCKSVDTRSALTPEAFPPDPVWAKCNDCLHEWQICGAKNASGGRCGKPPMDNGRCDLHGGKATGRPLIHGRRSKFLPARLQERAEEALKDPELVGLLEDIALVEALMIERIEQLGDESQAALWARAIATFNELKGHKKEGGLAMEPEAGSVFDRLGEILQNGEGQAKAEKEILGLQEHKRKLSDTEIKRQYTLNQFVSAKELNVLFAAVLTILKECVRDPDDRRAVAFKLAGLIRSPAGGRAIG